MSTISVPNQTLASSQALQDMDHEIDVFLSGKSLLGTDEPGALPILRPPPLPTSLSGIDLLEQLVRRRTWSEVIHLSQELLTMESSPYSFYYSQLVQGRSEDTDSDALEFKTKDTLKNTVQIIVWRLRAFRHLRRYSDLNMEVIKLRLIPSHIQTLPSWVPSVLILEGLESSTYNTGEYPEDVIDSICRMRCDLLKNEERIDELFKLDIVMSNILIRKEEWRLALARLDNMLLYVKDAVKVWMKHMEKTHIESTVNEWTRKDVVDLVTCAFKVEIYSREGRLLLQAGCLPEAATIFERAHNIHQTMKDENDDLSGGHDSTKDSNYIKLGIAQNIPIQILMNEGLLHFAHLDYDLAQEKFTRAIEMVSRVQSKLSDRCLFQDVEILSSEGNFLIPCVNNLALSSLYTCRMREAVAMLEALIREDATKYLTECLAFNLCTMYELGYDTTTSNHKKRLIQRVAGRFALHDVGQECFRLG